MSDRPCLVVTGHGSVNTIPDQCVIVASLNAMAGSPAEALELCSGAANQVISALEEVGVLRRDVQTMNMSVQDFFDQNEKKVTARIASHQLTVKVHPLDMLSSVVGSLTTAAGDSLQIRALNLSVSNPGPLEKEARALAVHNAASKAADFAQAAGLRLGPILSIEDDGAPRTRPRQPAATATSVHMAASMPVEPGETTVRASVTMTYALGADEEQAV